MKIINVVGARPNFIKIAPLQRVLDKFSDRVEYKLVHTGQHYDTKMSDVFFEELKIRKPDYFLNVGSGSHGHQTGRIMIEFENILDMEKPDMVLVVGDVNSTLACAIDCAKKHIRLGHIEAGCRSFDMKMPEEVNRKLTDAISDYLFAFDAVSVENLINEGISKNKIYLVGDIMIDSLKFALEKQGCEKPDEEYCVVTLHRPSNVDSIDTLEKIYAVLKQISEKIKIIFPIHPRTKKIIFENIDLKNKFSELTNLEICEPYSYLNFIKLISKSKFVLSDSGGIQVETTYMNVPCLIMRDSTERKFTIEYGSAELVGLNEDLIISNFEKIMLGQYKTAGKIDFLHGKTSEKIVEILLQK